MDDKTFREYFKLCVGTSNQMSKARDLFEQYCELTDKYEDIDLTEEQDKMLGYYVNEMASCLDYFLRWYERGSNE